MKKLLFIFLFAAGVSQTSTLRAEKIQPPCLSNENLRHFRTPSSPQLAPAGRKVVYVVEEGAAERGLSHLWWADVEGPESAKQITFSPPGDAEGETHPRWMPDGSAILFLAKRGKHREIHRLPADGGEAAALRLEAPETGEPQTPAGNPAPRMASHAPEKDDRELEIESFEISPDGKWLAALAKDPESAGERKRKDDKDDAVAVDRDPHRERVWLYSFADGKVARLTGVQRDALTFAWSRDSRRLAIVTMPPGNSDDLGPAHSVDIVDVAEPSQSRTLTDVPPTISALAWSPKGDKLAFLAQARRDAPPGIADLYTISLAGGTARDISEQSDLALAASSIIWSPDATAISVEVQHGTKVTLARFDLAASHPELVGASFPVATDFATNLRQTGWVFIGQASGRPPEVEFTPDLYDGRAPARLSRSNPDWLDLGWTEAKEISWASSDGLQIHGLLLVPGRETCPGLPRRSERVPLIVSPHGGPTGAWLETFSLLDQLFLAQGWAVLKPNPRGSTGYGSVFTAANKNDLGGKDYEDIMAGLDWVVAHYPVDTRRLGVYGYSYGGEMAAFIETKTDRFAAVVSGAPVIDQYSEYGTEGDSWYDRWFFGQPWLRPADAWRQSPLAGAAHARTPFLLLQGDSDSIDPLGQSQEMYRALRQTGVPVELIRYPREDHGGLERAIAGLRSQEPWHGFDARKRILDWFTSHFPKD